MITSPGLYWWRLDPEREFGVEEVFEKGGRLYVISLGGTKSVESLGGEWGGLVPSRSQWLYTSAQAEAWRAVKETYGDGHLILMDLIEVIESQIERLE